MFTIKRFKSPKLPVAPHSGASKMFQVSFKVIEAADQQYRGLFLCDSTLNCKHLPEFHLFSVYYNVPQWSRWLSEALRFSHSGKSDDAIHIQILE